MPQKIKQEDMTLIRDAKPLIDGMPILIVRHNEAFPRMARASKKGYAVYGIYGITKSNDNDRWLDISGLFSPDYLPEVRP
ncbi:MAG: hypothetical protein JKY48_04825 [Flavobacteriales bacterium]|nr:hypothetical protein [Flavobacteriales bacterium]